MVLNGETWMKADCGLQERSWGERSKAKETESGEELADHLWTASSSGCCSQLLLKN